MTKPDIEGLIRVLLRRYKSADLAIEHARQVGRLARMRGNEPMAIKYLICAKALGVVKAISKTRGE